MTIPAQSGFDTYSLYSGIPSAGRHWSLSHGEAAKGSRQSAVSGGFGPWQEQAELLDDANGQGKDAGSLGMLTPSWDGSGL